MNCNICLTSTYDVVLVKSKLNALLAQLKAATISNTAAIATLQTEIDALDVQTAAPPFYTSLVLDSENPTDITSPYISTFEEYGPLYLLGNGTNPKALFATVVVHSGLGYVNYINEESANPTDTLYDAGYYTYQNSGTYWTRISFIAM